MEDRSISGDVRCFDARMILIWMNFISFIVVGLLIHQRLAVVLTLGNTCTYNAGR